MKMKGQSHSGGAVHARTHHHNNNNNNNNNNNTSTSASIKEAERRLSVILKTAKKMSFTADELSHLRSVKKLTANSRGGCRCWLKHILPVVVGLFALLMLYLLVQYSMDDQGFGCLQNTSEAVVTIKESVPVTPQIMTAPRVPEEIRTRRDLTRGSDDRGISTRRWVATNGQSLRKER